MEISRKWKFSCLLLGLLFLTTNLQDVQAEVESEGPSESECRPYIEKALKGLEAGDTEHVDPGSPENIEEIEKSSTTDDSGHDLSAGEDDDIDKTSTENIDTLQQNEEDDADDKKSTETQEQNDPISSENKDDSVESNAATDAAESSEVKESSSEKEDETKSDEDKEGDSVESVASKEGVENEANEDEIENAPQQDNTSVESDAQEDAAPSSVEEETGTAAESLESVESVEHTSGEATAAESVESKETAETESGEKAESAEAESATADSVEVAEEATTESSENIETAESVENVDNVESSVEEKEASAETTADASNEASLEQDNTKEESKEDEASQEGVNTESVEDAGEVETEMQADEAAEAEKSADTISAESLETEPSAETDAKVDEASSVESKETEQSAEAVEAADDETEPKDVESVVEATEAAEVDAAANEDKTESDESTAIESQEELPEEDLNIEFEIPENLRSRDHIDQLLKLDEISTDSENVMNRVADITLKELKKLYENAIKPLETLYKYRDLSNRHFGDSEIFSKPLVLFMGPWSGGKSSIINYLTNNEYNTSSLRTGAEPSPAYFNLLMYGDEPEVLDGTQLAADNTFSGLQKFGQGLEERLRGLKLPNKLLEKINIVEIPGILEVRKQISRVFPFNDACQWFIDRADIIFLVYDPSKLDVGPETEAILDQLKGREHQTRIILNKADQVKPEELMRVQGALIWNISPLMSSAQPPVMYTTSLWSRPYETWAPSRLLHSQERAFLRDLRSAVDKRIENKISSARRFAVRVRNHAKMVDCYLTTYYNHKSVFGNRKQVSDQIIEHPQDYHIYEGLSTLTNISRYDLPDPDVYKDFFRLNPLYDFQQLSATCTYFRGCPINRLDVAIAYDFPELVGKHKKLVEAALAQIKSAEKQQES